MPEIKIGASVNVPGRGRGTVTDVTDDDRVRVRLDDGTAIACDLKLLTSGGGKKAEKG